MKNILKLTSLLLCLFLLLTSVISCAPSETQATDESTVETAVADTTEAPDTTEATDTTETPDTTLVKLTIEELTAGFVDGEYTLDDSPVLSKELLTALHRMTGEEEYEEIIIDNVMEPPLDERYSDAVLWAGNKSIVGFEFTYLSTDLGSGVFPGFCGEGNSYEAYLRCIDDKDATPGCVRLLIGDEEEETEITRSDAVIALYRFASKVLNKAVSSKGDISVYADSEKLLTDDENIKALFSSTHNMYDDVWYDLTELYGEDILAQIWLWALDAGIVEPYPDNTLRPDATLTRAEFAAMLTRFIDYVK